jgi:hypothetical protein
MNIITVEQAKAIALEFINRDFDLSYLNDSICIKEDLIQEVEYGWVFYYNSKKFLETGDFMKMLMGNSPVFVNKNTEEVLYIRGDLDLDDAMNEIFNN